MPLRACPIGVITKHLYHPAMKKMRPSMIRAKNRTQPEDVMPRILYRRAADQDDAFVLGQDLRVSSPRARRQSLRVADGFEAGASKPLSANNGISAWLFSRSGRTERV